MPSPKESAEQVGSSQPLNSWPGALRVTFGFVVLAALVSVIQAGLLALGNLPASAPNLGYAAASALSYGAAVASGLMGRRRAFFWCGLAIACLQLLFTGRFLLRMVRLIVDLQVSPFPLSRFELWNVAVFALALSLAVYLLLIERPRLVRADRQ